MLKTSKQLIVISFAICAVIFSLPLKVIAQESTDLESTQDNNEQFCQNINKSANNFDNQLSKKISELDDSIGQQKKQIPKDYEAKQQLLKKTRGAWDDNRSQQIQQLKQKYKNDKAKKQAIDQFADEVDKAIEQRRAKVDEILNSYNSQVQRDIESAKLSDSAKAYRASILQSEKMAQQSCKDNNRPTSVRTQFMSNLLQARSELLSGTKGIKQFEKSYTQYSTSQQQELTQAKAEFKSKLQTAANKLKTQLK